uniref:Recombinase zinc beta ribbon domain n=1 Tax=Siphoviridae sp. ctDmR33 TaxID=2825389 RepID=A0A8S5UX36_9CAUD|nr:MAG TPA: Recombinase zinc beta ribbon domain [Siphoviridae sp. ctDmR33]
MGGATLRHIIYLPRSHLPHKCHAPKPLYLPCFLYCGTCGR